MSTAIDLRVACTLCGHKAFDLTSHLFEDHGISPIEFTGVVVSDAVAERLDSKLPRGRRAAPAIADLTVEMRGFDVPVWAGVAEDACLPLPPSYRWPSAGALAKDTTEALISVLSGRHTYVWGMPGTGKDAFVHAISNLARRPAMILSIVPGRDIGPWFFTRKVDANGTGWEYGEGFRAITEGYVGSDGVRRPYIVLVTDLDRADEAQVEWLRLLLDGISGRIIGPDGKAVPVLKGTTFVATANTAGGGDERGRMVSARPMDGSILDRFQRKFQFHYMEWSDEEPIARAKFPTLVAKLPEAFAQMGECVKVLRDAVERQTLYAEFSHRGVCAVLGHAEDIISLSGGRVPSNLMKRAFRAWTDGLPDEQTRLEAHRLIDPHLKGGGLDI